MMPYLPFFELETSRQVTVKVLLAKVLLSRKDCPKALQKKTEWTIFVKKNNGFVQKWYQIATVFHLWMFALIKCNTISLCNI